MLTNMDT